MSDSPRGLWSAVIAVALALTTTQASGQVVPQVLPIRDQIAVFSDALRASAAMQEHYGLPGRFVLIPLTEVPRMNPAEPNRRSVLFPLDTAVTNTLLRSGAVAGVCLPGRSARRCGNDERGIGVWLSTFGVQWLDTARVNVHVELAVVHGDRDYELLADAPPRHDFWSFVREDGRWRLSMPAGRPPR